MNAPSIRFDEPQLFKLTLADVEQLQRIGAFNGRPKAELIEGVLLAVSPQLRPHSYVKNELTFRLRLALTTLGSALSAQSEATIRISPRTAPEPDIMLTDAPMGVGYIPLTSVALVVEIADTSLLFDLREKRDIYASAGISEYWVVDVNAAQVHRFSQPAEGGYTAEKPIPLAGPLASLTLPDLVIDGHGIL